MSSFIDRRCKYLHQPTQKSKCNNNMQQLEHGRMEIEDPTILKRLF